MISIWHLIWIVPLSVVAGVVLAVGIIVFDDRLCWLNGKCEKENTER